MPSVNLGRSIFMWTSNFEAQTKVFEAMESEFKPKMVYLGEERIDGNRHELDFEHWNTEQGDPSFF